jgi:hypothetical protein
MIGPKRPGVLDHPLSRVMTPIFVIAGGASDPHLPRKDCHRPA